MNLAIKQPAWTAAMWMLLLSRCNDRCTSAATAAAFAPEYKPLARRMLVAGKRKRTSFGFQEPKQYFRTTATNSRAASSIASAFNLHSDTAQELNESPTTTLGSPSSTASITRLTLPHNLRNAWCQLVPPISLMKNPGASGCYDVQIEWSPNDDLKEVAWTMLNSFHVTNHYDAMVDYLADCMETFQDFCKKHFRVDENSSQAIQGFKARIVCTRGSSGTKCPKYHCDHVPVRWIQSLIGPGCNYIESSDTTIEEWRRVKHHLENDQVDKIFDIPGPSHLQGHQANEQQAVLLAGNRWNEFAKSPHPFVPPVLHKSPGIPFYQGRVLLTMDVVAPQHFD